MFNSISENFWYVFTFVMIPFLARITESHIQIFDFGIMPFPSKSKVTKTPKFNFLNFTKIYFRFDESIQIWCDAKDALSFYLLGSLFYLYLHLLKHETYWQRRKHHSQRHLFVTDILLHWPSTLYHCKIFEICIFTWFLISSWNRLS